MKAVSSSKQRAKAVDAGARDGLTNGFRRRQEGQEKSSRERERKTRYGAD